MLILASHRFIGLIERDEFYSRFPHALPIVGEMI